jgi:hypothetical protein
MKHGFHLRVILLFMFLCVGCSDNTKPRQSDALQQISRALDLNDSNTGKLVKVSRVSYDNGFVKNANNYTVAASWDVTFLKSAYDLDSLAHQTRGDAGLGLTFLVMDLRMRFGDFKAGDVFRCSNEFPFFKN